MDSSNAQGLREDGRGPVKVERIKSNPKLSGVEAEAVAQTAITDYSKSDAADAERSGPERAPQAVADVFGFREGGSSNTPSQKTTSGGEDWLKLSLYLNHNKFEWFSKLLNEAQEAAIADRVGADEIRLGDIRCIVSDRGAKHGTGSKASIMRWKLVTEHGIQFQFMNRETAHRTNANAAVQVGSVPLMQFGLPTVWELIQQVLGAIGCVLICNKVSRVDPCVDLAGVGVDDFAEMFRNGWFVTRGRQKTLYGIDTAVATHSSGVKPTGFSVGCAPNMFRLYDKSLESARQPEKLALLVANRWGRLPEKAVRGEFELGSGYLRRKGVSSLQDWIVKRAGICNQLCCDWFRLTTGPVDRNHAGRSDVHPLWEKVRNSFLEWCGGSTDVELTPLARLPVDTSRQYRQIVGIAVSNLARVGKLIQDNAHFLRELEFYIREAIGERDLAFEVRRKTLELGNGGLQDLALGSGPYDTVAGLPALPEPRLKEIKQAEFDSPGFAQRGPRYE